MKTTLLRSTSATVALLATSAILISGCSGSSDYASESSKYESEPMAIDEADYAAEEAFVDSPEVLDDGSVAEAGAPVSTAETEVDPQIIRTANVYLEVVAIPEAVKDIDAQVSQMGGSVSSQRISDSGGYAYASMTVRVPAEDLDSFLASLEDQGTITSSEISASDVTLEYIDLQARIQTLEDSINRLRELQAEATTVEDLLSVERELSYRQADLESLQGRLDYLSDQVSLSTVYLEINEKQAPVSTSTDPDFLGGFFAGLEALLNFLSGMVTVIGFLLPISLIAGLVALIVVAVLALTQRKGKK